MVPSVISISKEHNTTVFICHCDPLIALGVASGLRIASRFDVRQIDLLDEAFQAATCDSDCVVVCDFDTGLKLVEQTWGHRARPRVVVVTSREKEVDIQHALSRGILGYLLLGCQLQDVVEGVIAASRGQRFLTSSAAELVANQFGYQPLTQREVEVLTPVALGWSNKMIANQLGVTEGTVKCHVKAILSKLGVRSRTEAANVAMRRGLVSEPMAYDSPGQDFGEARPLASAERGLRGATRPAELWV